MCKIRQYFLNVTWPLGTWCLVGANIDRFLCSHHVVAYRQFSTKKMAKRYLISIFIFFALLFIEVVYCFEGSIPNVPVLCYGRNIPCRLFNDWAALSFNILLPSIFLAVFGALTIRNIRYRVIHPMMITRHSNTASNDRVQMRHKDRNLTRMLSIQVNIIFFNFHSQVHSNVQNSC